VVHRLRGTTGNSLRWFAAAGLPPGGVQSAPPFLPRFRWRISGARAPCPLRGALLYFRSALTSRAPSAGASGQIRKTARSKSSRYEEDTRARLGAMPPGYRTTRTGSVSSRRLLPKRSTGTHNTVVVASDALRRIQWLCGALSGHAQNINDVELTVRCTHGFLSNSRRRLLRRACINGTWPAPHTRPRCLSSNWKR
jgi:hypothetical protein